MHNSPSKVLELVNNQICSNNQAEMFVTVWLGILTISEGRVVASNAGHEYPIIKKGSGSFEVLKDKHGFVIGGLEDSKYTEYEFFLGKGDTLFVYTDGLLESTNSSEELFGMDRILEHLNITKDANPEMILDHMKNAVKGFVGEAQQFDDLTMLAIKLLEKPSNSVDN
jgi:sigma-B regulation protein RsbU (phosphoserine phosphatase)